MYAIVQRNVPAKLIQYLNQPLIQSIGFDGKSYHMDGVMYGGLLRKLKSMYYPQFNRKKRRGKKTRLRKGSSISEGKMVDKQLTDYVETGKKPRSVHTKALIEYFERQCNMRIVAAQVPVFVRCLNRITQADLIVEDEFGRLIMIEVKCGYNQMQKQGDLKGLPGVPCRQKEIWELQRHYTHKGLKDEGLDIVGSHVVNVYREGKGQITVQKRKVPKWALEKLK